MYKVLIVDDELPVRIDLKSLLDWEAKGLELIEDATNGAEAMERIAQYQPDLIILDLGMPVMNGLEVLRRLKKDEYCGKIIVLSCHDDFCNVSEALKIGAADYLLKHMLKAESLAASIKKAIDLLKLEDLERLREQRMKMFMGMSLPVLRSRFVNDLVSGALKDHVKMNEILEQLNAPVRLNKFVVAILKVDDLYKLRESYEKAELERLLKSMGDILDTTLKGYESIYGCKGDGEYCIIFDFDPARSYMHINSKTYEICERIRSNIKSYLSIQVSVGLSGVCENPCAVDEYYTQAKLTLDGKLYLGGNRIIHFSEVENYNRKFENFLTEYEQEIIHMVLTDEGGIDACLQGVFSVIAARKIKPEHIRILCFELLMLVNKMIKGCALGYKDVFDCDNIPYDDIMNLETLLGIQDWFVWVCHRISNACGNRIQNITIQKLRPEIIKALEYIKCNYARDINLQDVADASNLSRTYFSQVFKHELNETFTDYLTRFRIEKAKNLLKTTQMKIYEVGTNCGFDNYRYFTHLFKGLTGLTPMEYKKGKTST